VVADDHHERVARFAVRLQAVHQPADLLVHEGDLAGVGIVGIARPVRLRRCIGDVGVVQVNPEKERSGGFAIEPREGVINDLVGRSLGVVHLLHAARFGTEPVDVRVEALVEPPARQQHVGGDKRRRAVAVLHKQLCRGGELVGDGEAGVVAHAVVKGIGAGEQRGVRRQRQRHGRVRPLKQYAGGGERIDGGCFDAGEAVGSQAVGARRVEADDDHVEGAIAAELRHVGRRRRSAAVSGRR